MQFSYLAVLTKPTNWVLILYTGVSVGKKNKLKGFEWKKYDETLFCKSMSYMPLFRVHESVNSYYMFNVFVYFL